MYVPDISLGEALYRSIKGFPDLATDLPKIKGELPHLKQVVSSNIGDYLPFMKLSLGKLLKKIPSSKLRGR